MSTTKGIQFSLEKEGRKFYKASLDRTKLIPQGSLNRDSVEIINSSKEGEARIYIKIMATGSNFVMELSATENKQVREMHSSDKITRIYAVAQPATEDVAATIVVTFVSYQPVPESAPPEGLAPPPFPASDAVIDAAVDEAVDEAFAEGEPPYEPAPAVAFARRAYGYLHDKLCHLLAAAITGFFWGLAILGDFIHLLRELPMRTWLYLRSTSVSEIWGDIRAWLAYGFTLDAPHPRELRRRRQQPPLDKLEPTP